MPEKLCISGGGDAYGFINKYRSAGHWNQEHCTRTGKQDGARGQRFGDFNRGSPVNPYETKDQSYKTRPMDPVEFYEDDLQSAIMKTNIKNKAEHEEKELKKKFDCEPAANNKG